MNKIKTFEDFNKVNELSTALTNRATLASGDKRFDNDKVGATKNVRQTSKFTTYINPEFKNKLKLLGVGVSKTGYDTVTLNVKIPDRGYIYIYVSPEKYDMDLDPETLDNTTLNKINRAIKLTQQELKGAIPAENEL
jgi:hypothetical protein